MPPPEDQAAEPRARRAPRRPEDAVVAAVVALGGGLRAAGLRVTVDQEILLCRGLGEIDVRRRDQMYWAARATLLGRPDEVGAFDLVFERFWEGRTPWPEEARSEHGESDPRMPAPQHGGDSLPQFRQGGRSSPLLDGQASKASQEIPSAGSESQDPAERREPRGLLAAYSPEEVLAEPEVFDYARDELTAVRRLAEELRASVPERRSRRLQPSRRGGRLDLRRTVRRSLTTDGELLRPARSAPSRTPRRIVFLCDVSGSMDRYSRALLAALGGVAGSGIRGAEAFVFATRLTRLTQALGRHDTAAALEQARAAVTDWSGGTRIGQVVADFNATHGRRGLARGAIVVVVSDGWDRGDPDLLGRELARLRLQCRRLVWLNPRPVGIQGQPLAVGMRAALPHVDDFVPAHDARAVAELARVLAGLGSGRPVRRQRAAAAR